MGSSKSRAVAARQAALERLQARERPQLERIAEAVVDAQAAHAERETAQVALDNAEGRFRAAIAALVELGQSHEQIAELCELDVSAVRSARRAKPAAEPAEVHTLPPLAPAASEGAA